MFWTRKRIIRFFLFLLAVAVAVTAFATAVRGWLHRDSGYYDVDYSAQTATELFDSGVHLKYYLSGSSADIRAKLREVQGAYSDQLLWISRQMDAKNTYEGITNLASLNAAPGEWVEIGEALEKVLRDAKDRTAQRGPYSLFAGPLHQEWQTLRYLDEPQSRDPLNDEEEAALLAALTGFIGDGISFSLDLEAGRARLNVSEDYRAWAKEQEIDAPVLDLNLMKDAYVLHDLACAMTQMGYTAGYLYTDSGLSVLLNTAGEMAYALVGGKAGEAVEIGQVKLPSPSAFCQFTAFSLTGEKYGYYTLEQEGKTVYRHPFASALTGYPEQVILTAGVGGEMDQLPNLAEAMLSLCGCQTPDDAEKLLAGLPEGCFAAYTLQENEKDLLYALPRNGEKITLREDAGFELAVCR